MLLLLLLLLVGDFGRSGCFCGAGGVGFWGTGGLGRCCLLCCLLGTGGVGRWGMKGFTWEPELLVLCNGGLARGGLGGGAIF